MAKKRLAFMVFGYLLIVVAYAIYYVTDHWYDGWHWAALSSRAWQHGMVWPLLVVRGLF